MRVARHRGTEGRLYGVVLDTDPCEAAGYLMLARTRAVANELQATRKDKSLP